jgi:hypothetical protein
MGALAAALLLYGGILIALNGRLPQMPLPLRSTSETGS